MDAVDEETMQRKYQVLRGLFNKRELRLWAAVAASELGRDGISMVARATGLSRTTIYQGLGNYVTDRRVATYAVIGSEARVVDASG